MSTARSYKKDPDSVKIRIARSQNPYLFSGIKIPRTPANHWIKLACKLPQPMNEENLSKRRIKTLEKELACEKALVELVRKVRNIFPHSPLKGFVQNHFGETLLNSSFLAQKSACDCSADVTKKILVFCAARKK